jgi:hypothetical protein
MSALDEFLMFFAPFIILIASLIAAFWFADKDEAVRNKDCK